MSQRSHDYLRTPEAAEMLRVSPDTLAKWRVHDTGPNYYKAGHVVLYNRAELSAWITGRRHPSAPSAPSADPVKANPGNGFGHQDLRMAKDTCRDG